VFRLGDLVRHREDTLSSITEFLNVGFDICREIDELSTHTDSTSSDVHRWRL
jgi:hypothetical protein